MKRCPKCKKTWKEKPSDFFLNKGYATKIPVCPHCGNKGEIRYIGFPLSTHQNYANTLSGWGWECEKEAELFYLKAHTHFAICPACAGKKPSRRYSRSGCCTLCNGRGWCRI